MHILFFVPRLHFTFSSHNSIVSTLSSVFVFHDLATFLKSTSQVSCRMSFNLSLSVFSWLHWGDGFGEEHKMWSAFLTTSYWHSDINMTLLSLVMVTLPTPARWSVRFFHCKVTVCPFPYFIIWTPSLSVQPTLKKRGTEFHLLARASKKMWTWVENTTVINKHFREDLLRPY